MFSLCIRSLKNTLTCSKVSRLDFSILYDSEQSKHLTKHLFYFLLFIKSFFFAQLDILIVLTMMGLTIHVSTALLFFGIMKELKIRATGMRSYINQCCRAGRVSLPKHRPFPFPLEHLVSFNGGPQSNNFMRLIRQYNSLFAFTSLGVHVDNSINTGGGPYVFRINGVVHHRIGSLIPSTGKRPEYAQLYIYDTDNELQNRLNIVSSEGPDLPDPQIVLALINMLNEHNPLVKQFRMARDRLFSPTAPDIAIKLAGSTDGHGDRYSLPTTSELADRTYNS